MAITFTKGPELAGRFYFQVKDHDGKLLATSEFYEQGWQVLASANCIIASTPTVRVRQDDNGRWYFEALAGPGSPTVPEHARLLTSERHASQEEAGEAARRFMDDAKKDGPDGPVVVLS